MSEDMEQMDLFDFCSAEPTGPVLNGMYYERSTDMFSLSCWAVDITRSLPRDANTLKSGKRKLNGSVRYDNAGET